MKVLDSSGVINLREGELKGEFLTVPEVRGELKDIQARLKFEAALDENRIKITEPSDSSIETVTKTAEDFGVMQHLSNTDLNVLALGLETKYPIVTDDYDIQNICLILGLAFESVIMPKIKKVFRWEKKCFACGKASSEYSEECETCGSSDFKAVRRS